MNIIWVGDSLLNGMNSLKRFEQIKQCVSKELPRMHIVGPH